MLSELGKLIGLLPKKKENKGIGNERSAEKEYKAGGIKKPEEKSLKQETEKSEIPEQLAGKPEIQKKNSGKTEINTPSKKSKKGKNRNKLPVLSKDEDLYDLFGVEKDDDTETFEKVVIKEKITLPPKKQKRNTRTKNNKLGIPVIEGDVDFSELFKEDDRAKGKAARGDSESGRTNGISERSEKKQKLDKHGLPILSSGSDIYDMFDSDEELHDSKKETMSTSEKIREEDFARLLESSLGGKTQEVLLSEKRDHIKFGRPPTLKERLKRYPPPQGQLDLHGYTAIQAEQATDSYIRNGKVNGTFTLRLIVGKGIHSEGDAVLPDVVEDKLIQLKSENIVLSFEWENKVKRKSGAVIVYIKQFD